MKKFKFSSLVSQIIALFFFFNALSLLLFTIYLYQQDKIFNMTNIEESLQEISKEKAQIVSLNMNQIKNDAENLAYISREYLLTNYGQDKLPRHYKRDHRGVLGRTASQSEIRNSHITNIYLPKGQALTPDIVNEVIATEKLEKIFHQVLERNKYIQWAYITTQNGMIRISPFVDNDYFEPTHNQLKDIFYTSANELNNPNKKTVWTQPYYDYLQTGWMVTCSCPIYNEEDLLGVLCLDLKLDTLKKDILADFRLGKTGFAFLINKSGDIIYHPEYIPTESQQGTLLARNIFKEDLTGAQDIIINYMISGKEGIGEYEKEKNHEKIVSYSQIPEHNWALGVEIDKDSYFINNKIHTSKLFNYLLFSIIILITFAAFLFRQYSKPFILLTSEAQKLSEGNFEPVKIISNFKEVQILSEAFNSMSKKLKIYTESLIHRTNQIETVFNSIDGVLMIVNDCYEIQALNKKGFYRYCGVDQEIIGQPCYKVIAGIDNPCTSCNLLQVLKTRKPAYSQVAMKNEIYSNAYFPIIVNDEKPIDEIIVYSNDITENIMIEKEITQAEKMAGIGQLSSAIAHELKNPLTVIKGVAYVLNSYTKDYNNELITKNLKLIDSSVNNAEKVIYNLLDFSSQSKKDYEQVDISKLIEQILLLERKSLIKHNISLEVNFNPNPLIIFTQIEPLKHIFLNIIANAKHALGNGGTISVNGHYKAGSAEKVEISISDNGQGIPYNLQSRVFNPFFTTKEQEGTGLGLWITKLSVERLSGEIKLYSTPGKGTKFTIVLPIKK